MSAGAGGARRLDGPLLAAAGGAVTVGAVTAVAPSAGLAAAAGALGLTLVLSDAERFARRAVALLAFVLTGYAFLGKGFAYLGVPPLFIGEITLVAMLLAALLRGTWGPVVRSPVVLALAAFGLWGASRTVPYWPTAGIVALRDAVLWGYGAFVVAVAALLARREAVEGAIRAYGRYFVWLPLWMPFYGIVARLAGASSPIMPGSDVPLLYFKPGDAAVHLAGIAAFVLLGLGDTPGSARSPLAAAAWRPWAWWVLWFGGMAVAASASRGGFLAAVLAVLLALALGVSRGRRIAWWRPAVTAVVVGAAFVTLNVDIDVGLPRKISPRQFVSNVLSIGSSNKADIDLAGTVEWRLAWWDRIRGYTLHGPYFWTGKGFGVNLSEDDGFRTSGGLGEAPNRNPHSIHYNVLARAGVPGAALWAVLQGAFVASMLAGYRRARRRGWDWWERVNIWVLAYWLALVVNGSFDVFIEGPQGGIWFWSTIGLGVAALEAQRRHGRALGAAGWVGHGAGAIAPDWVRTDAAPAGSAP